MSYCPDHAHKARAARRGRDRTYDATRRDSAARKFYKSAAWLKCRAAFLKDPERGICAICAVREIVRPAVEVDHIVPLSAGGAALDWANLQGLCKPCHGRKTRKEQKKEPPINADERRSKARV